MRSKLTLPTLMSNFRQNSYALDFEKETYSCRKLFQIFFNFWHDIKNDVLTSILAYFFQKSGCGGILLAPPSTWFYCYYRPPYGWRSPAGLWSADQCGTNQDSNQFLVPGCVIVGGWWLSLFRIGQLEPHCSVQIPETVVLYDTLYKYQGRWV